MEQGNASSGGQQGSSKIRHSQGLGQPITAGAPRPGQPGQQQAQRPAAPPAAAPPRPAAPPSPPPRANNNTSSDEADLSPLQVAAAGDGQQKKEIRAFGGLKRHVDQWSRTPNVTGQGAIHVKTFHGKLTEDALAYMDRQINEWLDAHPEYEVKFISSSIGEFSGKIREPNLICQVWV
jgi:hypothetical protein